MRTSTWLLACLLLLGPACGATDDDPYDALVAAEHAFAGQATEIGVRDAFVAWFADDNLGFAPGPVAGRARWRAREPLKSGAQWKPAFAEVSAAGDFGYTLGPHRWFPLDEPQRTIDAGHFLSVWQRGGDGTFRNVFDHGIGHAEVPLPAQPTRRGPTAPSRAAGVDEATRASRLQALLQADRALAALSGGATQRSAVAAVADDLLLMREGSVPRPAASLPADDPAPAGMDLAMLRIATSADLGATAGWNGDAAHPVVYARVWRHDGTRWRLVVDLLRGPGP